MKVIVQNDVYERGERLYASSPLEIEVCAVNDEEAMLQSQTETGARCLIIGAEKYSGEFYRRLQSGTLVIRFGVGYDSVPLEICRERNLPVAYTPGTLDTSVAEHTVGLMLGVARDIPRADRQMKGGDWENTQGRELREKTLTILGLGAIGQQVAGIAKKGFGMNIQALDIFPELDDSLEKLIDLYSTDYGKAVAGADFVSIHMKACDETYGFIDYERLSAMEEYAVLINTARGTLINEGDLYRALEEKIIAGAALDVYHSEPYRPEDEEKDLRKLENVVLTPHTASNTDAANRRMTELCIQNALNYYRGDVEKVHLIPEFEGMLDSLS